MFKRKFLCFLLCFSLLMASIGAVCIYAEHDSYSDTQLSSYVDESEYGQLTTPGTVKQGAESVTFANTNASETINITDENVLLELGKSYQLVHDNIEIVNIYSFSSIVAVTSADTIRTDEVGTTNLSILYYNENNILSTLSCHIEIIDISGTIDMAKGNVFVEKGKNYWLIHSEQTPTTISSTNHSVITFSHGVNVLVAEDVGTANLAYSYSENNLSIGSVCTVDVYESLDINTYKVNSTDNFFITFTADNTYENTRYAITYSLEEGGAYPVLQFPNYSWYEIQEFTLIPTSDNYFEIYSSYNSSYLIVDDSSFSINSEIKFSSLPLTETQVKEWKLLIMEGTSLLLVPKGAESAQLFVSVEGSSLKRKEPLALKSYTNSNGRFYGELYNSNIYINNYYDHSLNDEVGTDLMVLAAIGDANNFVNIAFSNYYSSMKINMNLSPTYISNSPADQCTTGVNKPCDDILCGDSHEHKNLNMIFRFTRTELPRKNNEITVLWSDRELGTFCEHNALGCEESSAIGITSSSIYENRVSILMLSIRKFIDFYYSGGITNEKLEAFESICLAHEITHTLGKGESYERETHILEGEDEYTDSIQCIMEYAIDPSYTITFYQSVLDGEIEPLCDACYNDWIGNMNRSFFKGNCN